MIIVKLFVIECIKLQRDNLMLPADMGTFLICQLVTGISAMELADLNGR
jgi:hypothetical protein